MPTFYKMKDDSIDALFIGSSHVYMNVNTNTLWRDYGIASYDLCGTAQPLWNSYFYLKEALKTQHPEVVVVDVYTVIRQVEYAPEFADRIRNFWGMKYSADKKEAVSASIDEELAEDYLLKFPVFHERYQDLSKEDFEKGGPVKKDWMGYMPIIYSTEIERPDNSYLADVEQGTLTEKNAEYLRKLIELSFEENVDLVLMVAPYTTCEFDESQFKAVQYIADDYGVPFYNFNYDIDQIGFDYATDYFDTTHLCYKGAEKFTTYLANTVLSEFNLTDHRGEKAYENYDRCLAEYERYTANRSVMDASTVGEYVSLSDIPDTAFIFYTADRAVVYANGERVYISDDQPMGMWHRELSKDSSISVDYSENGVVVYLNSKPYTHWDPKAMSVLVYDSYSGEIIGQNSFDIDQWGEVYGF